MNVACLCVIHMGSVHFTTLMLYSTFKFRRDTPPSAWRKRKNELYLPSKFRRDTPQPSEAPS